MRTYELLFIVAPTEADEAVDALVEQLRGVATDRGATVTKTDKMGRRRLAYPIRKSPTTFTDGVYVVLTIEGDGSEIAELERRLRVTEPVIRHLTVRIDEDVKRAEKFKARRQAKGRVGRRQRGESAESAAFVEPVAPAADVTPGEEEVS